MKFNRNKKVTHVRVGNETRNKIEKLKLDITSLQGKPITNRELLKRTFNMHEVETNLKMDARMKRRLRKL